MNLPAILAHGLGGRTDLPIPRWMVLYGGASVVVISFAALVALWRKPRWAGQQAPRHEATAEPSRARTVAAVITRGFGLVVFVVVLVAAAVGSKDPTANIAPTAIYITTWVGVALVNGLVFDLWSAVNPFDSLVWIARGEPTDGVDVQPMSYWVGTLAIGAFVWLELVYPSRADPRVLALVVAAYSVAVVAGGAARGRRWLRGGEGFTALFRVLALGAPIYRGGDNRLHLRAPFSGLARLGEPPAGLVALVLVVLGSTTFDGLTRTDFWTRLAGDASTTGSIAIGTLGLAWAIGLVGIVYFGAMRVMARLLSHETAEPSDLSSSALANRFAPSLVPIALAYTIAHYFSFLMLEGQAIIYLVSDPLGRGWDLFGTASRGIDYALLSPTVISSVQGAAIIAGHVAGVVVAHDLALANFPRAATRTQYPLLGAMVVFTVGGLFLLLGG